MSYDPEAEEHEADKRIQLAIAERLAKPKLRPITTADHGPWDIVSAVCLGCGRTLSALFNETRMPPCGGGSSGD